MNREPGTPTTPTTPADEAAVAPPITGSLSPIPQAPHAPAYGAAYVKGLMPKGLQIPGVSAHGRVQIKHLPNEESTLIAQEVGPPYEVSPGVISETLVSALKAMGLTAHVSLDPTRSAMEFNWEE